MYTFSVVISFPGIIFSSIAMFSHNVPKVTSPSLFITNFFYLKYFTILEVGIKFCCVELHSKMSQIVALTLIPYTGPMQSLICVVFNCDDVKQELINTCCFLVTFQSWDQILHSRTSWTVTVVAPPYAEPVRISKVCSVLPFKVFYC